MPTTKISDQQAQDLTARLEKKYQARRAKKRPRMAVSGKKVFALKKIIINKKTG